MKYLILSNSNSTDNQRADSIMALGGNSSLIDAKNITTAKHILQKSLNKNNINQKFEIIDLTTSEKKYYVVKKNKTG